MKKPVQGKKLVYMYRPASKATQEAAKRLMYTTENGFSISMDADATATKDGSIRTPGTPETELTAESILAADDPMIKQMKKSMAAGEKFEIWEANLDEPATEGTNKFAGTYYEGYLTSFEVSSSADDFATVSLTFGIEGIGADGNVTIPDELLDEATYVFKDTVKETAA